MFTATGHWLNVMSYFFPCRTLDFVSVISDPTKYYDNSGLKTEDGISPALPDFNKKQHPYTALWLNKAPPEHFEKIATMPHGTPMNAPLVEAMQHLVANPTAWVKQMALKQQNPEMARRPDLKTAEPSGIVAIWMDSNMINTAWAAKLQEILPIIAIQLFRSIALHHRYICHKNVM